MWVGMPRPSQLWFREPPPSFPGTLQLSLKWERGEKKFPDGSPNQSLFFPKDPSSSTGGIQGTQSPLCSTHIPVLPLVVLSTCSTPVITGDKLWVPPGDFRIGKCQAAEWEQASCSEGRGWSNTVSGRQPSQNESDAFWVSCPPPIFLNSCFPCRP